jgi:dihydrofolate reductase
VPLNRPRVSVYIAHSVDGYIADRDGSLDWLFTRAAIEGEDYGYDDLMASVDGLAMGRGAWDFIADEPSLPFGERKVYVFTHREAAPRAGVQFWSRTPVEAVAEWRAAGLTRVYVDGGRLISDFLAAGLVDDLTLTVVPVLLGSGSRLFHEIPVLTSLALESSQAYSNGVVQLRYRRTWH